MKEACKPIAICIHVAHRKIDPTLVSAPSGGVKLQRPSVAANENTSYTHAETEWQYC